MMKQVSAHFTAVSRIRGHHVDDLRACLTEVLTPHHLHLFDNMVRRMERVAEAAASKVCFSLAVLCPLFDALDVEQGKYEVHAL